MVKGEWTDLPPIGGWLGQTDDAKMLNVGQRSVERAVAVQRQGIPELQKAIETGAISVSSAADITTLPAKEQVTIARRHRPIRAEIDHLPSR